MLPPPHQWSPCRSPAGGPSSCQTAAPGECRWGLPARWGAGQGTRAMEQTAGVQNAWSRRELASNNKAVQSQQAPLQQCAAGTLFTLISTAQHAAAHQAGPARRLEHRPGDTGHRRGCHPDGGKHAAAWVGVVPQHLQAQRIFYVGRREAGAIVRSRAGQANAGHRAAACIDAADCPGEPTAAEADAARASRPPTHRSLEAEDEQSDPHDERKSKKQEADLCTLPEEATRRQQSDSLTGNSQAGRAHEHRSRAASASRVKQPQFRIATFGGA